MKKIPFLFVLTMLLLFAGCKKEEVMVDFLVETENSSDDTKTILNNESDVYWEVGDRISVRSENSEEYYADFVREQDGNKALFSPSIRIPEKDAERPFFALFPYNEGNDLGSGANPETLTIVLPAEQGYRTDERADYSFGGSACPMVAWGNKTSSGIVRLLFHNLCGVVRLQLYNTDRNVTIESIEFTSVANSDYGVTEAKPISGSFSVHDYKTSAPYVSGGTSNKVTITPSGGVPLNTTDAGPKSFYLTLPAVHGTGTWRYCLNMKVTARAQDKTYQLVKEFDVPIRRNAIVKMPVLKITSWGEGSGQGGATGTIGGNGTIDRPFLIYSYDELCQLRDICNSNGYLNGVNLGASNYYVRLMTSGITLETTKWTSGIKNFRGSMFNYANQNVSTPGIINNTMIPLFESISSNGVVNGLTVSGTANATQDVSQEGAIITYSPLCGVNNGTILNCMVSDLASYDLQLQGTLPELAGVGGICVVNNGTIRASGCRGHLCGPNVGGVCLKNNHNIVECYITSPMDAAVSSVAASKAGGIVYNNAGTVRDCYFAANISTDRNTQWGGIAHTNSGQIIHSYVDVQGVIRSKASIGGIVHDNSGTVDNCWNESYVMAVTAGSGGIGGLVYNQLADGTVKNSVRYNGTGSFNYSGNGALGGLICRMSGGEMKNCAFYGDMSQSMTTVKGTVVGSMTGGTIENVYGYQNLAQGSATAFYGQKSNAEGCTITGCYGQIAVGENIISLISGFSNLRGDLNTWVSSNNTYMQWIAVNEDNNPPTLTTTVTTKKKVGR